MTPLQKAKNIYESMIVDFKIDSWQSKSCALLAINEAIEALEFNSWQNQDVIKYYKEIKEELEKL